MSLCVIRFNQKLSCSKGIAIKLLCKNKIQLGNQLPTVFLLKSTVLAVKNMQCSLPSFVTEFQIVHCFVGSSLVIQFKEKQRERERQKNI